MISGSFTQRPSSENIRTRAGDAAIIPISASFAALEADGDRADGVHVDQPDLATAAPDVLDDHRGVGHRVGVRHREDRGVAPERRGGRAGVDGLGLLAAGLAQVGVQVDQPGQGDQPVGVDGLVGVVGAHRALDEHPVADVQVGGVLAVGPAPRELDRAHATSSPASR